MTIPMPVIAAPAERTRSVIRSSALPVLQGDGDRDYVCFSCGNVLAAGLKEGQLRGVVFKCPRCLRYCEPPPELPLAPAVIVDLPLGTYQVRRRLSMQGSVLLQGQAR